MADKDKRFRLVVKLPRPRSFLPSSTISNKSPSSHAVPRSAAPPALSAHVDTPPPPPPQSSAPSSGAAAAAANVAVSDSPATKQARLPQKAASFEDATAAALSTAANKRSLTTPLKKRKFKALVGGDGVLVAEAKKERPSNGEMVAAVSKSVAGPSVRMQPAQATPTKKVLEAVLEKLKKKDTYGVFSEPVDASMVPDYYDVIKEPMDFGTIHKKIMKGTYVTLNLFEKDILLICSNAMQYNAPDTVYYKQARSIQTAARKALDVVATQLGFPESAKSKPQKRLPQVTKKNWRTTAALRTALQPANSDYASGATLATEGDDVAWSNKAEAGHLKKVTGSNRSGSVAGDDVDWDVHWDVQSSQSGRLESEPLHANLLEEPSLKPVAAKESRRPFLTQEYHRSSYRPRNLPAHGRGPPLAGVGGELHQIVPTGYHMEHAYAKSLSRFSVNLGFEGWSIASKRIQRVLSSGVPFGRGWVGHLEAPPGTDLTPPISTTRAAEVKAPVPAVNNHRSLLTSSPLDVIRLSTTASYTLTVTSLLTTPSVSQAPMMSASATTSTSVDSLLTTVTRAMIASGSLIQPISQVKQGVVSTFDVTRQKMVPERVVQSELQVEQSRGSDVPTWHSQLPSNQYVNQVSSGMGFQGSSGMGKGISAKWTGAITQGVPTFVYSTAVQAVPSSAGMKTGLDVGSKDQAHSLGLLWAEANARMKLQSDAHLSQAPQPQHMQPLDVASYGLHSNVLGHTMEHNLSQTPLPQQPTSNSTKQDHSSHNNSSQPSQLPMGSMVNYGFSQPRPLQMPTTVQQNLSSKPPPDLNLRPVDSPLTPQTTGQPNLLASSQSSLFLQL